jgi:GDP-L-fucose synthase
LRHPRVDAVPATAKIFVAGSHTLIGSALIRFLRRQPDCELVGIEEPVLTDAGAMDAFLQQAKPDFVFVAAGKSGGITANQKYPADFCLDNLQIATAVVPAAHRHGVRKLLYLGSSCMYPKLCSQPMAVESLLTGAPEPTSDAYALAKLAGMKLCQAYRQQYGAPFITAIPADVFGPGAKFSAEDSHVVPSLLVKMHEAKLAGRDHITLWGTGTPQREFTFVDDLAEACWLVMNKYDGAAPINIGAGEPVSIRALAELAREVVGFTGELRWDTTKPDGAPIKLLDSRPLRALGWRPATPLKEGLRATYRSLEQKEQT